MKKFIFGGFIVGMISLLGVGALALGAQEDTTEMVEQSWTLTSPEIEEIYMVGTNQPVNLIIESTDNDETTVTVSGMIPKRSVETLSNKKYTKKDKESLHLAFEKPNATFGTGHVNINPESREIVTVKISLAQGSVLKQLEADSTGGEFNLTPPKNVAVAYDLEAIDAEVVNAPQSSDNPETTIKITNYYDNIIID